MDNGVVKFLIVKGDNRIEAERFVRLDKNVTTCPRCSRISGGYFEAIIQLRGDPKKVAKSAESIMKRLGSSRSSPRPRRRKRASTSMRGIPKRSWASWGS